MIGSGSGYGYDGYGYGGYSNNDRHHDQHEQLADQHGDVHDQLDEEHARAHEQGLDPWEHRQLHRNFATSTLRNIIKSPVSISASTTTTIGATTRATEMMDITGTELA